jgi:hypothetical protein
MSLSGSPEPEPAPVSTRPLGLSRRALALMLGAPIAGLAFKSVLGTAGGAAAAQSADAALRFLTLSKRLTGHPDLDATTSQRLLTLLNAADANFAGGFSALVGLEPQAKDQPALMAAAKAGGQDALAHTVVTAWYTGTVGKGPTARMVAYADALMYRPVADALYPPTYCAGGPGWWTAEPPPVGVSRPVERAPTPPPTVGSPEPKPR